MNWTINYEMILPKALVTPGWPRRRAGFLCLPHQQALPLARPLPPPPAPSSRRPNHLDGPCPPTPLQQTARARPCRPQAAPLRAHQRGRRWEHQLASGDQLPVKNPRRKGLKHLTHARSDETRCTATLKRVEPLRQSSSWRLSHHAFAATCASQYNKTRKNEKTKKRSAGSII